MSKSVGAKSTELEPPRVFVSRSCAGAAMLGEPAYSSIARSVEPCVHTAEPSKIPALFQSRCRSNSSPFATLPENVR